MNLPNKLTVLRVLLIPIFVIFMIFNFGIPHQNWIALTIFVIASLTDLLDGKIARKRNLVTNFGKFMDPLADKMLVCSALVCLIPTIDRPGLPGVIPVLIILWREFIISGFRLVAAKDGIVLAAGMSGKIKTVCQIVMVVILILHWDFTWFFVLEWIAIVVAVFMPIYSLTEYLVKNKNVFSDGLK